MHRTHLKWACTHTHTFLCRGLTQCQTELSNNNRNKPRQLPDREQWALGPNRALLLRCLNTEPGRPVRTTSCSINTRKTAGCLSWGQRGQGRGPHQRTWRWTRGISDKPPRWRLLRRTKYEAVLRLRPQNKFKSEIHANGTHFSQS